MLSAFLERFEQRRSASGKLGHSSKMKILVALRWLGSGRSYDDLDDSCRIGAETIRKIGADFCRSIVEFYGDHVLNRRPNPNSSQIYSKSMQWPGFRAVLAVLTAAESRGKTALQH